MLIKLKDGSEREFKNGISVFDIAKSINHRLGKEALGGKLNGKIIELLSPVDEDGQLEILTFDDEEGKRIYWHTTSHIMAQAVKRLYKNVKLTIGPAIDNGFYYDFDIDTPFTTDDFEKIESEMNKIIKENLKLERFALNKDEAIKFMEERNEPYKVELIKLLPDDEVISFYRQGEFTDLCAGPHLPSTGMVKAVKLLSVAGAYWRGDEKNKMLQRIYGISFPQKSMLIEYINMLEEAKKRDHRKLGKELDLFSLHEEGPGFPFFHPKGMVLRNILEDFWKKEHTKRGYLEIKTPIILNGELWHRSGHWDHYKENMYFTKIDDEDYAIKPMNCPGAMIVYNSTMHSYRDLPLRLCELGLVHRHELSGALHGLMRVRSFTQDDAHLFMTPDQVESEILGVIKLIDYFYKVFGFEYFVELSTRPEDSMGSDEDWGNATNALISAMNHIGLKYKLNEGDGAFYGPKIDFHLKDSIGRTWQCGTIQLDFQMPERFNLEYIGADGEKHRPIMLHRVVFGSIERFIAILIENFAGAFPIWLSPVQVKILPISDKQLDYAQNIYKILLNNGIRAELDDRNEKIGYKIREAQLKKIPYMLIVGDKEVEAGTVSIRARKGGDLGSKSLQEFLADVLKEIQNKSL
jgi:threonyl-tRNA synthetase